MGVMNGVPAPRQSSISLSTVTKSIRVPLVTNSLGSINIAIVPQSCLFDT